VRLFSRDSKADALSRAPLFEGLSKKDLRQLAMMTDDMDVPAGRVLCRQGDVGREFFVIVEGEVDVTRDGEHVATSGPGDFFGEIALVERVPRTATVTAKTPLRFFVLTSRSFWSLLDDSPQVERKVLRALAKRVLHQLETTPS
jgi:CRP/FNR family transcriptional regulator, cyclic AMP receptor protein